MQETTWDWKVCTVAYVHFDDNDFILAKLVLLTAQQTTFPFISAQHTAKFLVGSAMCGVITYISKCYPGSTTDKEIVADSGICEKLQVGDNIMADKGFLLHDILPEGMFSIMLAVL